MRSGAVTADSEVWKEGLGDWIPLGQAGLELGGFGKLLAEGLQLKEADDNVELLELFEQMDADGSGGLDKAELGELMHGLGEELDAAGLDRLMAEMDDDGNGTIEFGEFRAWFLSHVVEQSGQLKFQQRREKAARYARRVGVRFGPSWDAKEQARLEVGLDEGLTVILHCHLPAFLI